MAKCYAEQLGDCQGTIEDEHFIPVSLQKMIGQATISGFAWQKGNAMALQPGSFAHTRILCRYHHDQLDGLDGNAVAYFRNLMLIANPNHIATGIRGKTEEIAPVINGRGLEKWFLKTICGFVATGAVKGTNVVPLSWVQALFNRIQWSENWAMYVESGIKRTTEEDAQFNIEFHWAWDQQINGVTIRMISINTWFTLVEPDRLSPNMLKRPKLLGAEIERDDHGDVLEGLPRGKHILFHITWPK